jgi:hypothetical protein
MRLTDTGDVGRRRLSRRGPPRPSSASSQRALPVTRDREETAGCGIASASALSVTNDHAGNDRRPPVRGLRLAGGAGAHPAERRRLGTLGLSVTSRVGAGGRPGFLAIVLTAVCMGLAGPAAAQPAGGQPGTPDNGPESAGKPDGGPESAGKPDDVTETNTTPGPGGAASAKPDAWTPARVAEPAMRPGVLPALGAVFPGMLVHGTGHRIGGDSRTANRLLRGELLALGIAAAGGIPLGLTGASRRLSLPAIALILGGGGLLLLNWNADVYGSAGLGRVAGTPRLTLPRLETRLGYLYVYDPQFAYGSFASAGGRLRRDAWHVDIDAALALDDDNQRVRLEGGRRFLGPVATGTARDGSALGLDAALTLHRYGSDGFASLLGQAVGRGRYDLARIAPSLEGAFAEMWLGLGLEVVIYDGDTADPTDWLLGGFGFGMYLGEPAATHGEVRVYYDHFRGDLAGGLALPGGVNGYWGRLGVDGFAAWNPRWGVSFRAEVGSAYLASVGLVYRRP